VEPTVWPEILGGGILPDGGEARMKETSGALTSKQDCLQTYLIKSSAVCEDLMKFVWYK